MPNDRSTKRQRELLTFVDGFIQEHGYGPSYREIMRALGYKSVSTVAVHVDGLIAKGYLNKRTRSARSLEVVSTSGASPARKVATASQEKWLLEAITVRFNEIEQRFDSHLLDELYVLIGTLKILELEEAHLAMKARLGALLRSRGQSL